LVVEHLQDVLEAESKVVVFAHHLDMVDDLQKGLDVESVIFTGEEDNPERQRSVDRFQSDDGVRVFLGTIGAAGKGITLTAASHVVFAELDWVPANMTQAEDRCHRIGQDSSVLIQHLVLEGSLDASMAETLVTKQEIIDQALDAPVRCEELKLLPVTPHAEPSTAGHTYSEITTVAEQIVGRQRAAIFRAVREISGLCDGAASPDGVGFNRFDARIGHELASNQHLTQREAALGLILVRRYRKQLSEKTVRNAEGSAATTTRHVARRPKNG
jgi:Helicase conserved C-terminal domain